MKRFFKAFLLTLLSYLLQVCVSPHIALSAVAPNLIMVNIAVLAVSYGKKFAFGAGALSGILMETMCASVPSLYIVFYPVAALICAQAFADLSDRQREWRRMHNKRYTDLPAWLRILFGAGAQAALLEIVMLFYLYLNGVPTTWHLFGRSLLAILYTTFAALCMLVPERWILGMYTRRRRGRILFTAGSDQTQYYGRPSRAKKPKADDTEENTTQEVPDKKAEAATDEASTEDDDTPSREASDETEEQTESSESKESEQEVTE